MPPANTKSSNIKCSFPGLASRIDALGKIKTATPIWNSWILVVEGITDLSGGYKPRIDDSRTKILFEKKSVRERTGVKFCPGKVKGDVLWL